MRVRPRPDLVVLSVRGEDARTWLNGQITNDVRAMKAGEAVRALVLNVKGRILADVTVIDRGAPAGLAMVIPRSEQDALRAHFDKYIIMEDVDLVLEESLGVAELHGSADGFPVPWLGTEVVLRIAPLPVPADVERIPEAEAELARVRAGRPAFGVDFGPTTYPQEAGLEGAVSFQKGCYLGQEVVCMLENRGQLSRRLARLATDAPVPVGAKVLDASGAELGTVTSSVAVPEGGGLALAYVKRAAFEDQRPLVIDGHAARR